MSELKPIIIAGCGPGHPDYLCPIVTQAVAGVEVLVGAPHLLEMFPQLPCKRIVVQGSMSKVLDEVAGLIDKKIAILASGDSGLYSLSQLIITRFGRDKCTVLPGISSVQLAFARLALDWSDALMISAHGRLPQITTTDLQKHAKVAILAGTAEAITWCAEQLEALAEDYMLISCEDLSLTTEKVRTFFSGAELETETFASRTIFIFIRKELMV